MAPTMKDNRGLFAGVGVIMLAVIVTVSIVAIVMNNRCSSAFWNETTIYPGAVLMDKEAVFLGVQRAVYHSDDAPETVEDWYQSQRAATMREAVTSDDFGEAQTENTDWMIAPDAANGGSLITFAVTCP